MNATERINVLKNFSVDRASLEEMILVERDANDLRAGFEAHALPAPGWLTEQINTIGIEIQRRTADDLKRRLKELDAAEATLLTATEKRARLAQERAAITARLTGTMPTTPTTDSTLVSV